VRRFLLPLLLATGLGAGLTGVRGQARDACRDEFSALADAIVGLERASLADHVAMLERLRRLQRRHAEGPDECRSDMAVEEVTLVNYLDRTEEAIRLADRYLASDLAEAFPVHRAFVLRVRGYAREALGQTLAGAQDYLEAAALAPRLSYGHALLALGDGVETALALGDLTTAERLSAESERIVRGQPAHDVRAERLTLGRVFSARTGLLVRALATAPPGERRPVAIRLRAAADTAVTALAVGIAYSRDPLVDHATVALAWSARALAEAVLGNAPAARYAIGEADQQLRASESVSRDAGYTVWLRAVDTYRELADPRATQGAATRARDEARRAGVLSAEAAAVEALGALAESAGDWGSAEEAYREAVALHEVERERLELQDWSVTAFAASQTPYRGLARLLARQGRARDAMVVLDQSRARHLRDLRAQVALRDRLDADGRRHVDSLLTAIEEQRLRRLRQPGADVALQISRLQTELRDAMAIDQTTPELDLGALQRTLAAGGRSLVSYLLGPDASFAFVVTSDTVAVRPLPVTEDDVDRRLAAARGPWAAAPDAALALAPLHALHQALLAPLDGLLPREGALVVVPDGALADLPFGVLLEAPADRYEGAPYLLRRRPVATELAAALLIEPVDAAPASAVDLVAVGRSRFGPSVGDRRGGSGTALPDLPHVADEIERVASHARRRWVALDGHATETALMERIRDGRVVHIASHAEASPAFPMHSKIHLWPGDADDGVVHLYEFQGRRIPADLVVLSGCATAGGAYADGEGTLGLHYGLRAAGARATLATLWPVDDRATADVMESFYAALAAGLPKDRALQRAQLAYLDAHEGLAASPFYWASFVLAGDPAPVALTPAPRVAPVIWGAGLVLLVGLAWAALRCRRRVRRPPAPL